MADSLLWDMVYQPSLALVGAGALVLLLVVLLPATITQAVRERRRERRLSALSAQEQLRAELAHLHPDRLQALLDSYATGVEAALLREIVTNAHRQADAEVTQELPLPVPAVETTLPIQPIQPIRAEVAAR